MPISSKWFTNKKPAEWSRNDLKISLAEKKLILNFFSFFGKNKLKPRDKHH